MAAACRLSLCMIVRDSSRTLRDCLRTISPWVDEKVVVDTGSTDDTRQISAAFGARVIEFPWCDDFSAARNESLRHATGEWLFWMDSDDTISPENGRELRALADKPFENAPTAYVMQVHCPGPPGTTDITVVDHVKLFRNDSRLRFNGRIHEQILAAIRRINGTVEWTNICVTHSGAEHSAEARRRKQQRDLRLLEMDLVERPGHPFVLFNFGMTYADMDKPQQALEYLQRSLLVASPDESHVSKAYALLVGCLIQLNKDGEARRILDRAQEMHADDPELHFRRGIIEQRARNYEVAIDAYHRALTACDDRHFSSRDRGITGYKARHNLAGIYRETGRLDHAELQWRLALAEQPNYRDGWCGLVETLLDQQKYVTLEVEIEAAKTNGLRPDEVACAAARLAVQRGDVNSAIELLDSAISGGENVVEPLRLKCQLLFEYYSVDEAIVALEELCRQSPNDGAAWHNLGTAYQKAGCNTLAVSCYQRSLAIRPGSAMTLQQLANAQDDLNRFDPAQRAQQLAGDDSSVDNSIDSSATPHCELKLAHA